MHGSTDFERVTQLGYVNELQLFVTIDWYHSLTLKKILNPLQSLRIVQARILWFGRANLILVTKPTSSGPCCKYRCFGEPYGN